MQKRLTVLAATHASNFPAFSFGIGKCRKTLNRTFPTIMFISHVVVIDQKE